MCIRPVATVDIRGGLLLEVVLTDHLVVIVETWIEVRDRRIGGGLEAYCAYYLVYVSVS